MKTWYIVSGRIPYDYEDSIKIIEAKDLDEAEGIFREQMLAEGESTELDEDGNPCVYVNTSIKVISETEPVIEWQNY